MHLVAEHQHHKITIITVIANSKASSKLCKRQRVNKKGLSEPPEAGLTFYSITLLAVETVLTRIALYDTVVKLELR